MNEFPPTLCPACSGLIEDSDLEWVRCGGQVAGMGEPNYVWRLRSKDEILNVQQRTKDMQKLARAMRYLVECHPYLPPDLAERVAKFCNMRPKS